MKTKRIRTKKLILPSHWASYLINADATGLDKDESAEMIDDTCRSLGVKSGLCVSAEEIGFTSRCDAACLPGNMSEYTFHIRR